MDIFLRDANATVSRHRRDFEHVEIETGDGFDGENVEIRTDPNGFTYEYEYYEDDESDGEEQFKISLTDTGENVKKWTRVFSTRG